MAINFDSLPSNNPFASPVFDEGRYKAKVIKAEMIQGKNPEKPPYLNVLWSLTSLETGKTVGNLFDIITEPTSDIPRYKLKRFIVGLGIPISGNFELKDLAKIIVGKSCELDITTDKRSDTPKSVIDVFAGEIYYPIDTLNQASGIAAGEVNASDSADVGTDDSPFDSNY